MIAVPRCNQRQESYRDFELPLTERLVAATYEAASSEWDCRSANGRVIAWLVQIGDHELDIGCGGF
jgi:hypothetical protein